MKLPQIIDFEKNKSKRYWKVMFFLFAGIMIAETTLFLFIWFIFPNNPISEFASVSALPVKYLVLIILGGASKQFFMGIFTYHAWMEWRGPSVTQQQTKEA
jgi:hypothetical protein